MKKLASKLLLFLPILFAVGAVNYMVDPSQLFGNGRVERQLATIMLQGQNVGNVLNYDHRLLQRFYFEGLEGSPNIIVLGSSRSMLVNSSLFPGQHLYNASVAGASLEDYLALDELLLDAGKQPEIVILDVSPWVFNRNNQQTRWKSLASEYLRAVERIGQQSSFQLWLHSLDYEKYASLFSLAYLQESLRWATRDDEFYATSLDVTGDPMKLSDGSRVYGSEDENQTPDELQEIVQQSLVQPYSLSGFSELDEELKSQFEGYIEAMLARGAQVIFLLVPYQTEYYLALTNDDRYSIVNEVEAYLMQIAADRDIALIGSYNPDKTGCLSIEFYDGLHPRPSCITKLNWQAVP